MFLCINRIRRLRQHRREYRREFSVRQSKLVPKVAFALFLIGCGTFCRRPGRYQSETAPSSFFSLYTSGLIIFKIFKTLIYINFIVYIPSLLYYIKARRRR